MKRKIFYFRCTSLTFVAQMLLRANDTFRFWFKFKRFRNNFQCFFKRFWFPQIPNCWIWIQQIEASLVNYAFSFISCWSHKLKHFFSGSCWIPFVIRSLLVKWNLWIHCFIISTFWTEFSINLKTITLQKDKLHQFCFLWSTLFKVPKVFCGNGKKSWQIFFHWSESKS